MSNPTELPDLPEPDNFYEDGRDEYGYMTYGKSFTAEQMKEYALAALDHRAPPEDEAPQAEVVGEVKRDRATGMPYIDWKRDHTLLPVGFKLYAAAQHAESGKEIESAYQRGYMDGMAKGRRDVAEDVKDSAPGTPEAPAGTDAKDAARYQWLRERWVGWRETDEARSTSAYRKREKLDEWIDRAAQLDGGQGEGAGHVE